MYESSTGVITPDMVASFLPAFCLLLVVGAAIAGEDEIPKEMMEKLKVIHEVCVNEGHDAPAEMSDEDWKPEHACYYKCFLKEVGLYQDGELTLPEQVESSNDIKKCIDEEKTSVDGCEISFVVKKCMEENGFN